MFGKLPLLVFGLVAVSVGNAHATTYTVGPSNRQYTELSALFKQVDLNPGDVVLVDGNATYAGDIIMGKDDSGEDSKPVVVRWDRDSGQSRPLLRGGRSTIKFEQSNHVVFEGFEITGGRFACVFSESHGLVVRDNIIRDCPSHGMLAADQNSGSLTFEYNEVYNSGAGNKRHSMYIQSDEIAYPDAVFRMRFNYVHSGKGGILMRSRHERNEVYYNWFEGSTNQEVDIAGPDCAEQKSGWSPSMVHEDTDFVGNVVVHTSKWRDAIRIGGDLNGRNQGRVRMVNNTVLFTRDGPAVGVRVLLGAGSLEAHNNLFHQTGDQAPIILEEEHDPERPLCAPFDTAPWAKGRQVSGSNNWVKTGSKLVPKEWARTQQGRDPMLGDIAARALRPVASSPLINFGNPQPRAQGIAFQSPQLLPAYEPQRAKLAPGSRPARAVVGSRIDIGALEQANAVPGMRKSGQEPTAPTVDGAAQPAQARRTTGARGISASNPTPIVTRPGAVVFAGGWLLPLPAAAALWAALMMLTATHHV